MKDRIIQPLYDKFTKCIENYIEGLILSKCRTIIDNHIAIKSGISDVDSHSPTMDDIKEKKFLIWAGRDEISKDTRLALKKYLFGYYLKYEQNAIYICFKSILKILFFTLILILLTAWISSFVGVYSKLIVFSVDMFISGFAIYVLYILYDLSYYTKRDQTDIYIYTYNPSVEDVDNVSNHLLKYDTNRLDVSKHLPVFISGFFVLLITFSFYTSSLINTEPLDKKIIYLNKKTKANHEE